VVSSTQDWEGEDLAPIVIWSNRLTVLFWKLCLMRFLRPGSIAVLDRGVKDTIQLLLLKDKQVIETFSSDT